MMAKGEDLRMNGGNVPVPAVGMRRPPEPLVV
jgi:hypothetical protein